MVLGVVVAACGGSADDPGLPDEGIDEAGTENGGALVAVEPPTIDPGSMPPPGEARLEVDGQTFVFRQSEMLEGPFACDIFESGITVNFQSDGHDLLLQGAATPEGKIIASATVVPQESGNRYASSGAGDQGAVATDGSYVLYEGRFDRTPKDDLASFTDVGIGTISVTCP